MGRAAPCGAGPADDLTVVGARAARQRGRRARPGLLRLVLHRRRPGPGPLPGGLRRRSPARCSGWSSPTTCSLLYVFWELTTVFSYLLIGHDPAERANRRAAMQALIVTTFGGLAMLVGHRPARPARGHATAGREIAGAPARRRPPSAVALVLRPGRRARKSALVPVPLLAARRDGRADPGQRLPARRGHGQGRRLPGRPARARLRRRARAGAPTSWSLGGRHHAPRRLAGAAPARHQAAPRLRHGQPARLPRRHRRRSAPGRRAGRRWRSCSRTRCSSRRCSWSSASSTTCTGTRDLRKLSGVGRGAPAGGRCRRRWPARRWPASRRSPASSPRRAPSRRSGGVRCAA